MRDLALYLRASQIEPERSRQFVSTQANRRAFLACRLPTEALLGCSARCGLSVEDASAPSVRAAAAVGMSAAAVDPEQGNSSSGSISFICICMVARAPSICRLASASRRARNPRTTASMSLALQSLGFSVSQRPSASKQSAALTAVRWLRATTRHWNPRRGAGCGSFRADIPHSRDERNHELWDAASNCTQATLSCHILACAIHTHDGEIESEGYEQPAQLERHPDIRAWRFMPGVPQIWCEMPSSAWRPYHTTAGSAAAT